MTIIIQNKWFCKLFKINGITLYPFIIVNDKNNKILINHEKIHIVQQSELYVIPFYFLYFKWYFENRKNFKGFYLIKHYWSYRNIPFEVEAFSNQSNLDYLRTRKPKSYRKYLK